MPRLACSSPPPTYPCPPRPHPDLAYFPFSSLWWPFPFVFLHPWNRKLTFINYLPHLIPPTLFYQQQFHNLQEVGPCTSFHALLENSCRAVAEKYPIVFTSKEVLKRLVLLLYSDPLTVGRLRAHSFCRPVNCSPLSSSLFCLIAKKLRNLDADALQNLTRISSSPTRDWLRCRIRIVATIWYKRPLLDSPKAILFP